MIWLWTAVLIAGIALLAYTLARVLVGGLAGRNGSVSVARRSGPSPSNQAATSGPSRARQILDERYAAGELSTQEYEHRRAVLTAFEEEL